MQRVNLRSLHEAWALGERTDPGSFMVANVPYSCAKVIRLETGSDSMQHRLGFSANLQLF